MKAPVLSARQVSKTLSAKKKKKKNDKSRNVLAWPKKFDHWPVLDEQAEDDLNTFLGSLLAPAKLGSHSLQWEVLKKVRGAERKEMRQRLNTSQTEDLPKAIRARLLLGLNCVTRAITRGNSVVAVLVAGDVQPQSLTRLVVNMCCQREVPVVVMETLQKTTQKHLGFGCMALGLKENGSSSPIEHFQPLVERVRTLSAGMVQSSQTSNVKSEGDSKLLALEIPVKLEVVSDRVEPSSFNIYRFRSSRKERAFVPAGEGKSKLAVRIADDAESELGPDVKVEPRKRKHKRKDDFGKRDFIPFGSAGPSAAQSGGSFRIECEPMEVEKKGVEVGYAGKGDSTVRPIRRADCESGSAVTSESGVVMGASVKSVAKIKRKVDWGNQDFINLGNVHASGKSDELGIKPEVKHKVKNFAGQQDFIPFGSPSIEATRKDVAVAFAKKDQALVPTETKESVPQRKLPIYRPLIVKAIQPNPNKKKKMKKSESAR